MCEPTTIALVGMGISAAAAGYGYYSQAQNAKHQSRFYQQARDEQDKQIFQSRSKDMEDRARRARAERARLRSMSAETGLTGTTVSTLLNDVDFQAGRDMAHLNLNLGNQLTESNMRHQSNLNMISQPDAIGTLLNTGLQIYGQGQATGMWGAPNG